MSFRSVRRNLPYFRGELNALVGNLSLTVKCICVTVICSYLLSYYEPAVDALSVIPGHLLPPSFRIWTLFTNPFLEIHLWEVCVDIVTVGLCGKLIEPLWGAKEMLYFFCLVNLCVAALSVCYYLFLYAVTFDPAMLFDLKIHGLAGYNAAVSVTVKQIMPDHVLVRTPLGKLKNSNVPLTVLTVSIITWAVGMLEGAYCTMFASGIVSSWIYLRFYQRHNNGTKGDMAENFTFASFFPNVLQPPISVVANSIFQFLVKIGMCRKPVKRFTDTSGPSSISITLPGSDPGDAERRRQKALKLLSERLGSGSGKGSEMKMPLLRQESSENSNSARAGPGSSKGAGMGSSGSLHSSGSGINMSMSSSVSSSKSTNRLDNVIIPVPNESELNSL